MNERQGSGWLRAAVVIAAAVITANLPAMTLAAHSNADGYVYQRTALAPLSESRSYVLYGTRLTDGRCHYDYPEIRVPDGATAWEVRDIGIDPVRCRKLVEEGIPAEPDPTLSAGEKQRTEATAEISESPASGGDAVTSTASGYHWVWWEDVLGIKMTQDRTNISWSYNGTCSTSGSTSGEWTWAWGTGWQILSYGGSEYESCAYYRGTTYSSFKNADFCPPGLPTVYTYYYYVRAYGYPNGSIGGTRSTDSVNECFWFWMHYQIRKVT